MKTLQLQISDKTWHIHTGEQWIVTGPMNSGKSYLARKLANIFSDTIALVTFSDQTTSTGSSWVEARYHSSIEYDFRTVDELLTYEAIHCISPFEVRPPEKAERARFKKLHQWVVEALHLTPLLDSWSVRLSNGEQRRLLLARAILKQMPIMILDDPYAGLDETMRHLLTDILGTLVEQGKTLILTVRNEDEIPPFITHRLCLEDREIRTQGVYQPPKAPPKNPLIIKKNPPSLPTPCVLKVNDLSLDIGTRTLFNGLSLEVHQGEHWLISGPNGAGKTTLFSLIACDNPFAYACDIEYFGKRLGANVPLWSIRSRISCVSPEAQALTDGSQTVEAAIYSALYSADGERLAPTPKQRKHARKLLTALGLHERLHDTLGTLSAGLVRLVLIIRALVPMPDLLLLDEPCLNLEADECKKLLRLIDRLLVEMPTLTVLCIAHRPEHVPTAFDRHLTLSYT